MLLENLIIQSETLLFLWIFDIRNMMAVIYANVSRKIRKLSRFLANLISFIDKVVSNAPKVQHLKNYNKVSTSRTNKVPEFLGCDFREFPVIIVNISAHILLLNC